jgi:hypothetical protein
VTQKICIIESNEIPIRVWQKYCETYRDSTLAAIFKQGKLYTTRADDVSNDFLYPSQTWASLNTGTSFDEHQVHWYNDPKPDLKKFWWHQAAMEGRRVGLVNVLHTSPLAALLDEAQYDFVLPDCFASTCDTKPERYSEFQSLNLQLTERNGRASTTEIGDVTKWAAKTLLNPARFGVGKFALIEAIRAVPPLLNSRERLRNMQFLPLSSIFFDLMKECDSEISVMFTNHVAAAQHRYWYALFPDDYAKTLYEKSWVDRYRNDILDAVGLLDRYLKKLTAYCSATGRILIIVSSMGQHANHKLTPEYIRATSEGYRLDDPAKFLAAVLGENSAIFERAMVPQYTYSFPDVESSMAACQRIEQFFRLNPELQGSTVNLADTKMTVTLWMHGALPPYLNVEQGRLTLEALGFRILHVDDHHSGCHHPDGTLLVWNDKRDELFSSHSTPTSFSYLDYACELRRYLGLSCLVPRYGAEGLTVKRSGSISHRPQLNS